MVRILQKVQKEKPKEERKENFEQTRIAETQAGADKSVKAIRFILAAKLFSASYAKGYDLSALSFTLPSHKTIAEYITAQERANAPGMNSQRKSLNSPE